MSQPPVRAEVIAQLVLLRDDRVLLCSRRGAPRYFLPGGAVGPGETVEDALRRRTSAQTGLTVSHFDLVGCLEHTERRDREQVHQVTMVFAAPLPWAAQIVSNDPELRLTSLELASLTDVELHPAHLTGLLTRWADDHRPRWHGQAAS